jgi:hypothetical protein
MKKSHVTLRMSAALDRALERLGRSRGVPKSQLVREAVARYLMPSGELAGRTVTGVELSERWALLPHLDSDEAKAMSKDITDGRQALPEPVSHWE